MRIQAQVRCRRGFTLLEVVLSVALAVLLLGGLYVVMWAQYDLTNAGREKVEQATLARSLFRRISGDILSQVAPKDPRIPTGQQQAPPAAGTEEDPELQAIIGALTETDVVVDNSAPVFNFGVSGGLNSLVLSSARVPREIHLGVVVQPDPEKPPPLAVSDLRRIMYWLVADGSGSKGLARMEVANITATSEAFAPEEVVQPEKYIIAPEVKDLAIRYFGYQFEGVDWHQEWDGTSPGPDGQTPVGPPAAIEITLSIGQAGVQDDDPQSWKTFRHVVMIPASNGLVPLTELQGIMMP